MRLEVEIIDLIEEEVSPHEAVADDLMAENTDLAIEKVAVAVDLTASVQLTAEGVAVAATVDGISYHFRFIICTDDVLEMSLNIPTSRSGILSNALAIYDNGMYIILIILINF